MKYLIVAVAWMGLVTLSAAGKPSLADAVVQARITGGLCVVVGEASAEDLAAVVKDRPLLVQVLVGNIDRVRELRAKLLAANAYGQVSVNEWPGGMLPYADNLASMIIVTGEGATQEELQRVLRPGGALMTIDGAGWKQTSKARPAGADDWAQWRHGADRNPVSQDSLVDVPKRIQWLLTPEGTSERSHVIYSNGRSFAQDKEWLIARDAYNGLLLWKGKLKRGTDFHWEYSVKVASLIVAHGDRVYAMTEDGKLKALDGASGAVLMTYEEADSPFDQVVVDDGKSKHGTLITISKYSARGIDAETGKLLWKHEVKSPHTLLASASAAYYIEGTDRDGATSGDIVARDVRSGELLWKKTYDWARRTELAAMGNGHIAYEMRNPNNWRELYAANPQLQKEDRFALAVIDAKTGEEVGKVRNTGSSARHGEFKMGYWHRGHLITEAPTKAGMGLVWFKPDDFTKPAVQFQANYLGDRGWGHCYPPVLTPKYYLNGQLNFTDLDSHKQTSNQITRGSCNTARPGYIPANGMLYTYPKHCVCFPMLDGNVCLAGEYATKLEESNPLVKGPAWPAQLGTVEDAGEWPMFRRDASRTCGTPGAIPAKLSQAWTATLAAIDYDKAPASEWASNPYTDGPVSPPVIAGGLVYVSQPDLHRVLAMDAASGKERWQFFADARVDGPPTIYRGLCLFGSRGGWVYCLRAVDGELIWKRRLAPDERRISVYGQVESPWPVPASIAVIDGLAYAPAGIHPLSDGGVRMFCLDPASGEMKWQSKFDNMGFDEPWPEPYDPRPKRPESNPWRTIRPMEYKYFDLPVRDGDSVAVSRCRFDLKTGKVTLDKTSGFYRVKETGAYLPRTAWHYGTARLGWPIAVSLGNSTYATSPATSKLFRTDFSDDKPFNTDWVTGAAVEDNQPAQFSTQKLQTHHAKWVVASPDNKTRLNRAMVVAGDRLVIATAKGTLVFHDVNSGEKLEEMKLEPIAWDGLAAAGGRLFVTTTSGKLICFGK